MAGLSLALSFDYAAKNAAPLRTKYLLAERSEDMLFIRTQSKRAVASESPKQSTAHSRVRRVASPLGICP